MSFAWRLSWPVRARPTAFPVADAWRSAPSLPPRGARSAYACPRRARRSPLPKVEFHEDDFSETERSRDPFRSFAKLFSEQGKTRVKSQRQVLLDRYAIDELKLIGLVTRTDTPRAMLVDPTGRGWVVIKGQFFGRAEVVHAGGPGGVDYELNWRSIAFAKATWCWSAKTQPMPIYRRRPACSRCARRPEKDSSPVNKATAWALVVAGERASQGRWPANCSMSGPEGAELARGTCGPPDAALAQPRNKAHGILFTTNLFVASCISYARENATGMAAQ